MQPSYFGTVERQLLGLYSPPTGAVERDAAVLICHPGPQEYMWSYRAIGQLAARLAAAGFHVFRFDYFGTGDSAGASSEGSLEHWRHDVAAALDELKDVSGVRRPSLVGFRLGAALAAQSPIRVRDLVLWEPVVSGREYLGELRQAHELQFAHALHPPTLPERGPLLEVMGHPLPAQVQAEIEALQLAPPLACAAERVWLVASEDRSGYRQLAEGLAAGGSRAAFEHIPDSLQQGALFLMATRGQDRIVKLLSGKAS